MFSIQMWRRLHGDEELRSVRVRSRVRHGQQALLSVAHLKIFILELRAINGFLRKHLKFIISR